MIPKTLWAIGTCHQLPESPKGWLWMMGVCTEKQPVFPTDHTPTHLLPVWITCVPGLSSTIKRDRQEVSLLRSDLCICSVMFINFITIFFSYSPFGRGKKAKR